MFLSSITVCSKLQHVWTIVLLVSQYLQIMSQMTTLGVSNLGRYGFMGSRGGSLTSQMGHRHMPAQHRDADDPLSGESALAGGLALGHGHGLAHRHVSWYNTGFLVQLDGFDHSTPGKAANGPARAGHVTNPFIVGRVLQLFVTASSLIRRPVTSLVSSAKCERGTTEM